MASSTRDGDCDCDVSSLWMQDVTPLPPRNRARVVGTRPVPVPVRRLTSEAEGESAGLSDQNPWDAGIAPDGEITFQRPGLPSNTLRRLRRGHWAVHAELDLHGKRIDEARQALVEFLSVCRRHQARCVRIIHGKGTGSRDRKPVLKHKVAGWLMQRDEVLAFCQARVAEGGSGAAMVLLKPGR